MSSSPERVKHKRCNPPGILILNSLRGKEFDISFYRALVLIVTFIAYACYHASRKPSSIVKSVLHPEIASPTGGLEYPSLSDPFPWPLSLVYTKRAPGVNASREVIEGLGLGVQKGWPPFNGKRGNARLGEIDVAFLAFYAFGMYFAGHLGDRVNLRLFLTLGMVGSGAFVCLFGMGYWWDIHVLWYFLFVQMMAGLFQATGWPSVVAIIGNWFGKRKRGLIMGIWNAHTSVGNIVGSLIAASALQAGWGWSFVYPGLLIISGGLLVYLFLVVEPAEVGLLSPYEVNGSERVDTSNGRQSLSDKRATQVDCEVGRARNAIDAGKGIVFCSNGAHIKLDDFQDAERVILHSAEDEAPVLQRSDPAVGFLEAWRIPGVAPFAFCLFFSKLVAYTFLYWLPFYIRNTKIEGYYLSEKTAGNLSTLFDLGGVVGGILAGHISDKLKARAITAASFMYCAIPVLYLYNQYGGVSLYLNLGLMALAGLFINGPYALITTAVSADLGTHSSLKGNAKALATVTAIIDGTGSVGAAIGPLLTGFLSERGWDKVFDMLMLSAFIAGLLLFGLVYAEIKEKFERLRYFPRQIMGHDDFEISANH
ncbi:hypothetical protein O6H91_19G008500 [Diphasiastrum complanatum]|uniref:Uncharacterized protein n=1 Tax=Diphasiastrum complanatum TaxID=34168 RepID=A0ACC2ASL7_DIPCM|nr:hypothetical protein O6H91_19G008500 [Diphasiastrum complanatum]